MLVKVQRFRPVPLRLDSVTIAQRKRKNMPALFFLPAMRKNIDGGRMGLISYVLCGSKHEANPEQRGAASINRVLINTVLGYEFFSAYHILELSNPCLNCSNNCIIL